MIIEYNYMVLTKIENMYYRTLQVFNLCACLSKDELQPTKTCLYQYRTLFKIELQFNYVINSVEKITFPKIFIYFSTDKQIEIF